MRQFVRTLTLVAFVAMSLPVAAADNGNRPVNLITVAPGRNWHLVGEWDIPQEQGTTNPFRYTLSILQLGSSYALVWDGDLIGGCCPWPQATLLNQLSDARFISAIDETVFEISVDSSLIVSYVDGRVNKLSATAPNRRFSIAWE